MDSEPGTTTTSPAMTLRELYDISGRRWFTLGIMLLIIMGCAIWTVRHDPLAISALFIAIAAILRTVPQIMQARMAMLFGVSGPGPGPVGPDADPTGTEGGSPRPAASDNRRRTARKAG